MKISVCMATYNGSEYVRQQVESILKQLDPDDELVISDDSSTDRTVDVIKEFNDKRVRLYEHNCFHNPILNFENVLKKAKGDMIFLADQDDIWLDNKVEVITKLLHSYDLVVSDCIVVDENETVLDDSFFKLRGSGPGIIHNLIRNSFVGCCMAFSRRILEIALPFPKKIEMHDMWIGIIGELFGKIYFCKEKLVKYRRHDGNVSETSLRSTNSLMKKNQIRINLTYNAFKRYIELKLHKSELQCSQ